MSMMCRPMWPFLLMNGSHDMRHTGFPQVDDGQRDPREMGRHILSTGSTSWEPAQSVQWISVEAGLNSEHPSLFCSYLPHSDLNCALFFFFF